MKKRPWINKSLAQFVFGVVIVILLFTHIDPVSALVPLGQFAPDMLVLLMALLVLIRFIQAYQMSFTVAPLGIPLSVFDLFQIMLISNFYGLLVPGELAAGGATWYKLARPGRNGLRAGAAVIYFRLINMLTVFGLGTLGVFLDPLLNGSFLKALVVGMFIVFSIQFVLLSTPLTPPSAVRRIELASRLTRARISLPPQFTDKLRSLHATLQELLVLTNKTFLFIVILSLLYHFLETLALYLLATSVGIHLSLLTIGWIRLFLIIAQMIPITFAGLGVREVTVVWLLARYGIPQAQALSLSFALFGYMTVAGLIGGLVEGWHVLRSRRLKRRPVSVPMMDATAERGAFQAPASTREAHLG